MVTRWVVNSRRDLVLNDVMVRVPKGCVCWTTDYGETLFTHPHDMTGCLLEVAAASAVGDDTVPYHYTVNWYCRQVSNKFDYNYPSIRAPVYVRREIRLVLLRRLAEG